MKLAVKKAFNNLAVIAKRGKILNPFIISDAITDVYQKLLESVPEIMAGEDVSPKKLMEALRTKDIYLSRDGEIVTQGDHRWRARYAGQQSGRYAVSDETGDKIASLLGHAGSKHNIEEAVRQAILNKQIEYDYIPLPSTTGEAKLKPVTPEFVTSDEMYKYAETIDEVTKAQQTQYMRERRAGEKGGTPQQRKEAKAAARRYLEAYADGREIPKKELDAEYARANKDPVRYLQAHVVRADAGGGGAAPEEKAGGYRELTKGEKRERHDDMVKRANEEAARGKLVKQSKGPKI
jgi:hypothetical protein